MRTRSILGNFGLVLLTAQILLLSAGIHNVEIYIAAFHSGEQSAQERFSPNPKLSDPASHQCSICFFNQLLSHCLFPELLEAAVMELFHPQECASPQTTSYPSLGREVNRSPPMSAPLF